LKADSSLATKLMKLKFIRSKNHHGELKMLTSKLNASALFLTLDTFIKELSEKDESMISGGKHGYSKSYKKNKSHKYYY
jgi:hypothetical protein